LSESGELAIRPDITFLLDLPVEMGMERAGNRGEMDRFEQETLDFFERVRANYRQRATDEPERFCVIDASKPLEQVQSQLASAIDTLLETQ